MRKILLCLFIVQLSFSLVADSKKSSQELRKIKIWEGEVKAVYKNKGEMKVIIHEFPNWDGVNQENIAQKIKEESVFEIIQKDTQIKLGTLTIRYVELQKVSKVKNKNFYHVVIRGIFKPKSKDSNRYISTNAYIAKYRYEPIYENPSSYYNKYLKDLPTDSATKAVSSISPVKSIIHPVDKKEMVFVPDGTFLHGQSFDVYKDNFNPYFNNLSESTLIDVQSFYIDKYEVTNLEYYKYVQQTNSNPPSHWLDGIYPKGKENHPVLSLSYREVEGYAKWTGKRIPTEFEWEKAARGAGFEKRLERDETYSYSASPVTYPFGDKFDARLCNTLESNIGATISVYELSPKSASVYGAIGMCGNAQEWTSSWYLPYNGNYSTHNSFGKLYKVIRGGSFWSSKREATVFYRSYGGIPNLAEDKKAGFRLVKDK